MPNKQSHWLYGYYLPTDMWSYFLCKVSLKRFHKLTLQCHVNCRGHLRIRDKIQYISTIHYYIPPLFFFSPFPVICPYLLALVLELLVLLFLYVPSPFVLPWAKQLMMGTSFVLMLAYFFFSSSNRCCSSSICFFCCNFCCSCSFWILSYTIILNCSCRLSYAKYILSLLSLKLVS